MSENPGLEVVSSNQYAGATAETAYQASENLLARFKAEDGASRDGIYCPNESSAFGMLRALQDSGLAGKVVLIGFDASEQMVRALENGEFDALVLQDPVNMAYLGVKTMVSHIRGEEVPARIDTGVTLVTRDNMNDPRNAELLRPDVDRWLNYPQDPRDPGPRKAVRIDPRRRRSRLRVAPGSRALVGETGASRL
jgi:ribose transport system substrate-binding protein